MLFSIISIAVALVGITTATVVPRANTSIDSVQLPAKTVASLSENNTFLENLAPRQNGDLVISMLQKNATLHYIKDPASGRAELTPIYTFPNANGMLGIGEVSKDTFLIAMHEFESFLNPYPHTGAVWEVKFNGGGPKDFAVRKVADLPDANMLNGMAVIPPTCSGRRFQGLASVLIADCLQGQLIRLDPSTGAHEVVLDVPELHAPDHSDFPTGVNGLKIHKGYVYWTNTVKLTVNRIAIDSDGYPVQNATVQVFDISSWGGALDDFVFDEKDNIWGVNSLTNIIYVLYHGTSPSSLYTTYQSVAGALDSLELPGPTAVTWGTGRNDRHILYVTTSGGTVQPVNGQQEPAKVVAIDTSSLQK
ncbi:unnamed protein product [Clonostachys rosea]|uniref:SMP-30/Gluconolactonase/LRE-like region domain-containing protein n=1 Tax=Bionectria ochroleuca TaxID=29856 RepID=A0ABY6UE75_BIOOC|nr:unnamed protein product [Clonostachys rosea]